MNASVLAAQASAAFVRRAYRDASQLVARLAQAGHGSLADELLGNWCASLPPAREEHVAYALQRAALASSRGEGRRAVTLYEALAAARPDRADVLNNLGTARLALGDAGGAVSAFVAALALKPDYARAELNRGRALIELDRLDEALSAFGRAIAIDPGYAEAHTNAGVVLARLGRREEAIAAHRLAIAAKPALAAAHANLGKLLLADEPALALEAYGALTRLAPDLADGWRGVASARQALKDVPGEIDALGALLARDAADRGAALRLGRLLRGRGRGAEAIGPLEDALIHAPGDLELRWQLARALIDAGRFERGMLAFEALVDSQECTPALRRDYVRALMVLGETNGNTANYDLARDEVRRVLADDPADFEALMAEGILCERLGKPGEAEAAFAAAFASRPDNDWARFKVWDMQLLRGDWRGYAGHRDWLAATLDAGRPGVEPHFVTRVLDDPARQQRAARIMLADAAAFAAPRRSPSARGPGRLRVAYVSADFRDHPVAYAMVELLERHDRTKLHVSALSLGPAGAGAVAERIRAAVDEFHELQFGSVYEADAWLRARDYDVLVDLMGHTEGRRPLYFAARPARVQVLYLGYPGTLGAPWLDYVLADRFVIPPGDEVWYDEAVARLPGSFFPTDTRRPRPATTDRRADHGLPEEAVVYCNFLARGRLTPEAFDRWLAVLERVPAGVLWLAAERPEVEDRLRAIVAARGLAPGRLVFAQRVATREAHLARHRHADLWLDSYPYGAHSTGRDALWMGLPVLTCSGRSFPARVATSLLGALGLEELITADPAEFIDRAVRLGQDAGARRALRARVEAQVEVAEVFDMQCLARNIERAFEHMVEREQRGLAPASFTVGAPAPAGSKAD